jgi:hypothetical protein
MITNTEERHAGQPQSILEQPEQPQQSSNHAPAAVPDWVPAVPVVSTVQVVGEQAGNDDVP